MPCYRVIQAIADTLAEFNQYLAGLAQSHRDPAKFSITEADVHSRVACRLGPSWRVSTQGRKANDAPVDVARPDLRCLASNAAVEFASAMRYQKPGAKAPQPANYSLNIQPEWKWLTRAASPQHRFFCLLMDQRGDAVFADTLTGFGKHASRTREHVGPLAAFICQRYRKAKNAKTSELDWINPLPVLPAGYEAKGLCYRLSIVGDPQDDIWAVVVDMCEVSLGGAVLVLDATPLMFV